MTNRYLNPSPLPFATNGATANLPEERAPVDVVESGAATGPGLHALDVRSSDDGYANDYIVEYYNGTDVNHDDAVLTGPDDDDAGDATVDRAPSREQLRQRDKFDREVRRARSQRARVERRTGRRVDAGHATRRRPLARSGHLDPSDQRVDNRSLELRHGEQPVERRHRGRPGSELPTRDHLNGGRDVDRVATRPDALRRFVTGPLQGTAMAVYFVLLPYVVVTRWSLAAGNNDAPLVRTLLMVLAAFWMIFLVQVVLNVRRLHLGRRPGSGGSAWLAGLVVTLLGFLVPSSSMSHPFAPPHHLQVGVAQLGYENGRTTPRGPVDPPRRPSRPPEFALGAVPLALMAKRRCDLLRQQQYIDLDADIDETVELLRSLDPDLINQLRQMIGNRRDGVIDVPSTPTSVRGASNADPVVACSLGDSATGSLVAFAREGGRLAIAPAWSADDVRRSVVALHNGRLVFAGTEAELLRALATRSVRQTLVIYLGHANDLDEELRSCAVTLTPFVKGRGPTTAANTTSVAGVTGPARHEVRVDLLRADPQVYGLVEPMTATLRRRCIEMLAYLALHRHEPVTGDRLRTRVLTHADVDASPRTLANTASALRRSLGVDADGPRLHPVTSSGLYVTHGVTSDVEIFTTLVGRARQLSVGRAAPLARQALELIKGEPLSSALRGFEWFLAEGYGARLSRDGEWAALALHHDAMARDEYELAFWALRQGLLIDPYSEVLLEASARVPRLREFGGDRAGLSQHEPVGAGGAEAMSWSLHSFCNQVSQ
jgi:hypothetical protein